MTRIEKRATLVFLVLTAVMLTYKAANAYLAQTISLPAAGGVYREVVIGDAKNLNPVFAYSDAEKSVSKLLFSTLVHTDYTGVHPAVAERWEISPDGLNYTFYLRRDVRFHDGAKLTAKDVAATIEAIKTQNIDGTKSQLHDAWKDVGVNIVDDYQIVFTLPKSYGPFIYNCSFGIIPSHLSPEEFTRQFVGSGPFKFKKSDLANRKITRLELERSDNYFGDKPYLQGIELLFSENEGEGKRQFEGGSVLGIFGAGVEKASVLNYSYQSSRRFGLIFNLRQEKLKDKELRRRLIEGERLSDPLKLRLVTLNAPLQRSRAESLKEQWVGQNVEFEVIYLSAIQLKDVLDSKEFEILLYGFNFGYDRDPYVFWHSSQLDKLNFAGYTDKNSDILLEDARMAPDKGVRQEKYDQFARILEKEYAAKFWEPIKYDYFIDPKLKGVTLSQGCEPSSRFDNVAKWYLKEKRVRK